MIKKSDIVWLAKVAESISERSKDPSTKVGCVIVDKSLRIVSQGYNGFVKGCNEDYMSFERPLKYHLVIHAEANAVLFAKESLEGCTAVVTHAPCENCLKHMLQSGIRRIYYKDIGPMKERSEDLQKEAVRRLIESTDAIVKNINGTSYINELFLKKV